MVDKTRVGKSRIPENSQKLKKNWNFQNWKQKSKFIKILENFQKIDKNLKIPKLKTKIEIYL